MIIVFGMRDAGEDVMCASFAENKGVKQENVSITKGQKDGKTPERLEGRWEGGTSNSAEQCFAPKSESSPPASSPWSGPVRSVEPDHAGTEANLKRFLCLFLPLLDILLTLGPGRGRKSWKGFGGNERGEQAQQRGVLGIRQVRRRPNAGLSFDLWEHTPSRRTQVQENVICQGDVDGDIVECPWWISDLRRR